MDKHYSKLTITRPNDSVKKRIKIKTKPDNFFNVRSTFIASNELFPRNSPEQIIKVSEKVHYISDWQL